MNNKIIISQDNIRIIVMLIKSSNKNNIDIMKGHKGERIVIPPYKRHLRKY